MVLIQLLKGLDVSLKIFVFTLVFSVPLGAAVSFLKIKKIPLINEIVTFYITIMRGTPLILQILFFYFAPAYVLGVNVDRFASIIFTFSLNYAAYFAEIFRSGFISIPKGQGEASKVLGFSRGFTFFRIYVPQIAKRILPAFSGEVITLVKDTALASTLGVLELFMTAQKTSSRLFSPVPIFVAGLFYFVLNAAVALFFAFLEKKYAAYSI